MADAPNTPPHFYATARGSLACRLVREQILTLWPDLTGQTILGLGYAAPYLRAWRATAATCIAACPTTLARWPGEGPNAACAVDDAALPFPDLSFDRILLIHGLETTDNARAALREIWRVLKDDGRLLVVAPNRVGLWAHVESTPFGHGQPYSPGQLERFLAANLFRVERRALALWVPPTPFRVILRTAPIWERAGRYLAPRLAGITITESVKDAYAAIPLKPARHRRIVFSEAA